MLSNESENVPQSEDAIREAIHESVRFDRAFVLMNALSAMIASYGLLSDSAAVVIGAMVIVLLLNPITGIALGIAEGDYRLFGKSSITLIGGVFIAYITAFIEAGN